MGHKSVESKIELLLKQNCLGSHYLCNDTEIKHAVSQIYKEKDLMIICSKIQKQLLHFAREIVPFELCSWVHLLETEVVLIIKRNDKHLYSKEEREAHDLEFSAWRNRGLTGALVYAFEGKPLGIFDEEIYKKYYELSTEIKKRFLSNLLLQYRLTTHEF